MKIIHQEYSVGYSEVIQVAEGFDESSWKKHFNFTRPDRIKQGLNTIVVGIGGLGVVNLSKHLRDLVACRYTHVRTVEQRGVAQRRSSTAAVVMASQTEVAPNLNLAETDLLVGLEPLEALRYSHTLRPGSWCFLSDARVETICGGDPKYAYPDTGEIVKRIRQYDCRCIVLPVAEWKATQAMDSIHAASAMLGLFCALFDFDLDMAKSMVSSRHYRQGQNKNIKALEWGYSYFTGKTYHDRPVSAPSSKIYPEQSHCGEAELLPEACP